MINLGYGFDRALFLTCFFHIIDVSFVTRVTVNSLIHLYNIH